MELNFRRELIENDRYYFKKAAKEKELSNVIGECAICGCEIHENDVDYLINNEKKLGLCADCIDECHWG
jgi:hypothetical protein